MDELEDDPLAEQDPIFDHIDDSDEGMHGGGIQYMPTEAAIAEVAFGHSESRKKPSPQKRAKPKNL